MSCCQEVEVRGTEKLTQHWGFINPYWWYIEIKTIEESHRDKFIQRNELLD